MRLRLASGLTGSSMPTTPIQVNPDMTSLSSSQFGSIVIRTSLDFACPKNNTNSTISANEQKRQSEDRRVVGGIGS